MTTASAEVPKYRLLADHFFEPEMVGKGSVIEYDGEPNHQMEPLNASAEAALDRWYNFELPVLDEKTGKQVVVDGQPLTHRPRWDLRPISQRPDAPKAPGLRVLHTPTPQQQAVDASVAALQYGQAKEWTRPGPEVLPPLPTDNPSGVKVVAAEKPLATTPSGAPNTTSTKV